MRYSRKYITMGNNGKKGSNVIKDSNTAKNNAAKDSSAKVMTNYDKKVLRRQQEEAKRKRNVIITKISCVIAVILVMIGIASYFVIRHNNAYGEYISVGDNKISKIEFDFYDNTTANNFISSYSSYLSYIGLDTTKSFDSQNYSTDLTWADYFDQNATSMIQQTKALVSDAKANNFQYDVTSDYNSYISSIKDAASNKSVSLKSYYKTTFGEFATESNLKTVIEEFLTASAYYKQLSAANAPTTDQISSYYASNKDTYDSINYRVLNVATEAAAKEMVSKVTDETSFTALCKTYATADQQATYATGDPSLVEGATASSISSVYSSWLYDSSRKYGDITVIEDTNNSAFCVVYFVKRYYDTATDQTIADTLTNNTVSAYISNLTSALAITDKKNHLKYLTVEASTAAAE